MSRWLITFLALSTSGFIAYGQDLTGTWTGEYTFGKKSYYYSITILQDGKVITGTALQAGNKTDSAQYFFKGTINNNGLVSLSATSYVFKKGLACLPKITLKRNGNRLEGKYGSNAVWGGCLLGVKGNITVEKEAVETQTVTIKEPEQSYRVDGFEGSELIKALKERKYYALIVATNEYPDPGIPVLSKPIADATLLIETLQTHYTFEKEYITFLKNPTRTELIETFDRLSREISNRDNLLIFYAGHGIWDTRLKQGFWLPTDASKDSKAQWLSNGTIRDYIRAIDSKHTLLITDACFGGSILKERAVFFNGKAMLEMYKRPSRKAMTSGALSAVPDESVFIKYLVKNLRNHQAPLVSAEQIFGDFKVAVINNSETGQVPQYGAISLAGDEGGDFIFLRRMKE